MELPPVTDLLPHRGRWLLVGSLLRVDLDAPSIEARGHFDPAYAEGHFPEKLVVPGVALLEGLAQTMACLGALLARAQPDAAPEGIPFLAAFDRVRFRAPVFPPADVDFRVTVQEHRLGLLMASGEARCGGKRVLTARLTGGTAPADAVELG
ncbi:MAG: FabA/FabZ family ACP-dehydratase [Myxococcota bacterium]